MITLAVIIILTLCIIPTGLAQNKSISINEINASFTAGDKIVVSGSIIGLTTHDEQVTMKVSSGDNVITVDQLDIARDGTFATILNTNGSVWKAGTHQIIITRADGMKSFVVFELRSSGGSVTDEIYTVNIGDGETGDIGYSISGGSISEMEIEQDQLSLFVRINPEQAGNLILKLDRDYIDAKSQICTGNDESFIVLVDDVQVPYQTLLEDTMIRTIEIAFESSESKIQIVGTCAIPEFGALALVVLCTAITGIIIVSKRFQV